MVAAARAKPGADAQEMIVNRAEQRLKNPGYWKEFYPTLPVADKQTICRVGIIGWLSGDEDN